MLLMLASFNVLAAGNQDAKGSKDHPLLTRMPGFHIGSFTEEEFGRHEFLVQDGKKVNRIAVEGHKYYFEWNIENALTQIGGKVLFQGERPYSATIKVEKEGKETWVTVLSWPTLYRMTIVERETMKQEVKANAEAMGSDLDATGHVSVYGIYFDTGKSDIKPESDAALSEIAKLLKNNGALKIYVVGHTDNVGNFEANMKLSKSRAAAVKNALVTSHGIAASRLAPYGVSSLCPVASNKTEEGKAKNRRVELVKQ